MDHFRRGALNVLVTTNALEEGVDVSEAPAMEGSSC